MALGFEHKTLDYESPPITTEPGLPPFHFTSIADPLILAIPYEAESSKLGCFLKKKQFLYIETIKLK